MGFELSDDYVTVAERIAQFREKYPEGSLQPADPARPYTIDTINGNPVFVVVAAAYRHEGDHRPGVGMAYEPIPGSTPYTRGSELQNAETAAWGRAIVAALAADSNRSIASREEVVNQRARAAAPSAQPNRGRATTQGRGSNASTGRQGPPPVDPAVMADWQAAIEAAGDYQSLLDLHGQAARTGAHPDILAAIKAAGVKAKEGEAK